MRSKRTDNHTWRKIKSALASTTAFVSAILVILPLGLVFFHLLINGISSVNWDFFTKLPAPVGEVGGGMANAIVGSLELLAIAGAIGIPVGVLGGVYFAEYGSARINSVLRFLADVLNGIPSITWGVVVYGLIVLRFKSFSVLAGGLALALIMIPLILRTTEEVVLLVPNGYREAALALGVSRWQTIVHIVMKTASKGIITGILLALARIGGETAPILFTAFGNRFWNHSLFQPIAALPLQIYTYAISPYDDWHRQAWAGALVLVTGIFCVNVTGEIPDPRAGRIGCLEHSQMDNLIMATPEQRVTERVEGAAQPPASSEPAPKLTFEAKNVSIWYGQKRAIEDVSLNIISKAVTAIIGPSGCGKSTFLRALNRMHELTPKTRMEGTVLLHGENLYSKTVDPAIVRRRVGMVFQKSNPFPTMTIGENVICGLRLNGVRNQKFLNERLEKSLRMAALWDEVKDDLHKPGTSLSGGQQQRLCIARALAVEPEVILMDEPCSALDPIATAKIEELINELKAQYTIVTVTHNMQQAGRVSDFTAFFYLGRLIEFGPTTEIFTNPNEKQTEDYITGRFG